MGGDKQADTTYREWSVENQREYLKQQIRSFEQQHQAQALAAQEHQSAADGEDGSDESSQQRKQQYLDSAATHRRNAVEATNRAAPYIAALDLLDKPKA